MRQEARQEAEAIAARYAEIAATLTGRPPTIYLREGKSREELLKLIAEDPSISVLVLGAVDRRGSRPAGHVVRRQVRAATPRRSPSCRAA